MRKLLQPGLAAHQQPARFTFAKAELTPLNLLADVMDHFGLSRSPREAGYFETEHHKQPLRAILSEREPKPPLASPCH